LNADFLQEKEARVKGAGEPTEEKQIKRKREGGERGGSFQLRSGQLQRRRKATYVGNEGDRR